MELVYMRSPARNRGGGGGRTVHVWPAQGSPLVVLGVLADFLLKKLIYTQ